MSIDAPSIHAIVVMVVMVAALMLYSRPNIPMATTSLGVLVLLAFVFSMYPMKLHGHILDSMIFFSGFSNEALIAVVALMIAGGAIVHTGALDPL
ncbi:transporter, partial [mine drainage metagenome]